MTDELLERLLGFGRELRGEGMTVGSGQILEFTRAAAMLGPADLYWTGRCTLVCRQADISIYDDVFYRYWSGNQGSPVVMREIIERVKGVADEESPHAKESGRETADDALRASRLELLRGKSFSQLTEAELAEIAVLMARLKLTLPRRRSRRKRPAGRGEPDVRRTVRRSFRTSGEPVERAWRSRRERPRRVVLLLDVSGSMVSYSRGLLLFAHAAMRAGSQWEAFCFSTRLTRITRALGRGDPNLALSRAADEVHDWDGGTRIGASLRAFLRDYGHGGMARGAVVVICSDGLEVGDPVLLDQQMRRLRRLTHKVIWLNPLIEQNGYQPIARGMRAALPHVDRFAAGHNLASLEQLVQELSS